MLRFKISIYCWFRSSVRPELGGVNRLDDNLQNLLSSTMVVFFVKKNSKKVLHEFCVVIHGGKNLIVLVIPGLTGNPVFSCPPEADRFRGNGDFCWN
ncbi:MAG: hypothetical protein A2Z51_05325 [Deltaproteobacteria bacterium RBG_19FT_COMBO_52_11]|nr:MAG: hypothetical protein A2Z51_05325 [Deltaproteobacteria bacterium RBG_19FT_COMBO_52_11]